MQLQNPQDTNVAIRNLTLEQLSIYNFHLPTNDPFNLMKNISNKEILTCVIPIPLAPEESIKYT